MHGASFNCFSRNAFSAAAFLFLSGLAAHAQHLSADDLRGLIAGIIAPRCLGNEADCANTTRRAASSASRNQSPDRSGTSDLQNVQSDLNTIGFDAGVPDGVAGPKTRQAINSFLRLLGAPETGRLTSEQRLNLQISAEVFLTMSERGSNSSLEQIVKVVGEQIAVAAPTEQPIGQVVQASIGEPIAAPPAAVALRPSDQGPALPTRVFAGPGEFPPSGFRGYGFIAFRSRASDYDFERHMIICQAYVSSLEPATQSAVPKGDQFVTVWPVDSAVVAIELNSARIDESQSSACTLAIREYDSVRSYQVLKALQDLGYENSGIGPFLLGWVPGEGLTQPDALILSVDLSRVSTFDQALAVFNSWKNEIETDPRLIKDGWSLDYLRLKIRRWADQTGETALFISKVAD